MNLHNRHHNLHGTNSTVIHKKNQVFTLEFTGKSKYVFKTLEKSIFGPILLELLKFKIAYANYKTHIISKQQKLHFTEAITSTLLQSVP